MRHLDITVVAAAEFLNLHHGEIPDAFTGQHQLSYLFLQNNLFSGQIPPSVFSLLSLTQLLLSHNQLQGPVSSSISKLVNLAGIENLQHFNQTAVLDLNSNLLQGPLPLSICNLSSLAILDFSGNNFTSGIPECLLLLKGLTVLDLGSNNFQGNNKITDTFPTWLETLPYLWVLILRHNRFHGPIGSSRNLLPFPSIRIFDLSHNSFTDKLGSLDMLQSLDLSWNQFTGKIPEQLANLTSLAVLDLSQNQLDCGEISAKHVPPSSMPQQKDGSEDFASKFSWRDVLMGCGCGLVFGFIMGLVMLRIAKPEWIINISECCYQKFKRR
ncbi:hypothetical protein CQW23_16606 [Capsicum baccatum]|uniref:Receptor-like protein 12 n=1 Tax=Capsicum baccatum TaxID=33114 RepID=A0A2G2WBF1_CAPBA|nr:hypothetical protein CQW23_16606 [Capsicum baccatum]